MFEDCKSGDFAQRLTTVLFLLQIWEQTTENEGGYSLDGKSWQIGNTKGILAITTRGDGGFIINMSEAAFQSNDHLYICLGHEYIHVQLNSSGFFGDLYKANQEQVAYDFSIRQAEAWSRFDLARMFRNAYTQELGSAYRSPVTRSVR